MLAIKTFHLKRKESHYLARRSCFCVLGGMMVEVRRSFWYAGIQTRTIFNSWAVPFEDKTVLCECYLRRKMSNALRDCQDVWPWKLWTESLSLWRGCVVWSLTWTQCHVCNLPGKGMLCGTYLQKICYVELTWRRYPMWNLSGEGNLPGTYLKREYYL